MKHMTRIVPLSLALSLLIIAGAYALYQSTQTPPPEPQPAATVQATTPGVSYTATQVAAHSTPSDCWTSINGSVYNLTAWVSQHPGGPEAIGSLCGRDGTAIFEGKHGENLRVLQALSSFKIGALNN